jgi:hypothetical protein
MRWILASLLLVAGGGCNRPGPSSEAPAPAPSAGQGRIVEFRAVADLPSTPGTVLMGAHPVDPQKYRTLFYADLPSQRCTASLVGPRVLLLAAHCVDAGVEVHLRLGSRSLTGRCSQHSEYAGPPPNDFADWALCALDSDVGLPFYESIGDLPGGLRLGSSLQLMGFGCTDPSSDKRGAGQLRAGDAKVIVLPAEDARNYELTVEGDAALCYGDSGGPAMVSAGGRRFVAGVNSAAGRPRQSHLASTSVSSFKTFAREWATSRGVQICGIHEGMGNCNES